MKKVVALLVAVSMMAVAPADAQGFLKKLGKGLENAVKEAVKDASDKNKSTDQSKKKTNVQRKGANTRVKANTATRRTAAASNGDKQDERVLTLPPRDHAFLAPMGDYTPGGTLEFVCPKPPSPDKDLTPWWEKLEPVEKLTNASLLKEITLLEPLLQREKYIINAMIDRYDKANNEFQGRLKSIDDMCAEIAEIHKRNDMHDPQWAINNRGVFLVRTLSSAVYHRSFRSSITVFRNYFDKGTVAWLDGFNKNWDALLTDTVVWMPYPETQTASAADRAAVAKDPGAVIAIYDPGMGGARYEAFTFTLLKTYARILKVDKTKADNADLIIPARIVVEGKTYPVTEIGTGAFLNCPAKSITIPNTVTALYREAFQGLTRVKTITVPASVKKVDPFCFAECKELTSVTLPATLNVLDGYAFNNCPRLVSVQMPKKVGMLGNNLFAGCPALKQVTLPNGMKTLGNNFFNGCKSLTALQIPNTVTRIGSGAFAGCSGLASLNLPPQLTEIGANAFDGCSKLTALVVPPTVTKLGNDLLAGCTAMKSLTLPARFNDLSDLYWRFKDTPLFPKQYMEQGKMPPTFKFSE